MWLLRAWRERKDGGEDEASKVRGEKRKGCRKKKKKRESKPEG